MPREVKVGGRARDEVGLTRAARRGYSAGAAMSPPAYTIVRSLGVGALSEALLARVDDGRHVVIKRLHRHLAHDEACAAMFAHEARALAALAHPGVAGLAEVRGLDLTREFAQAFAPGLGLDAVAAALGGPMPLAAAGEALAQLLDALAHVHARRAPDGAALRLVHRDVCPANVIASREGHVTLVDFGIATSAWRPDPDRGQLKGTRGYMAPEVVTGEREADARADLFAAAVILYELTVGRRLYEGTAARVMAAIADGPLPSPARDAPGYPAALDAVVRRGLARDPDARYPDAAAMRRDLDGALAAHGVARSREALAAVIARCDHAEPGGLTVG
jgi:serine/threonine protein kinase